MRQYSLHVTPFFHTGIREKLGLYHIIGYTDGHPHTSDGADNVNFPGWDSQRGCYLVGLVKLNIQSGGIIKEEDLYYLRKEGETSNNYYSSKPDDYDTKTDMFIYDKYSKYTTKEINSPDYLKEEITYYHYLELEKINYLKVLTSSNITILDIKLNNNIIKYLMVK